MSLTYSVELDQSRNTGSSHNAGNSFPYPALRSASPWNLKCFSLWAGFIDIGKRLSLIWMPFTQLTLGVNESARATTRVCAARAPFRSTFSSLRASLELPGACRTHRRRFLKKRRVKALSSRGARQAWRWVRYGS